MACDTLNHQIDTSLLLPVALQAVYPPQQAERTQIHPLLLRVASASSDDLFAHSLMVLLQYHHLHKRIDCSC